MINLPYSLVIEATNEPDYFGFYSPDLTGIVATIEKGAARFEYLEKYMLEKRDATANTCDRQEYFENVFNQNM
jgi:xylose isomerase